MIAGLERFSGSLDTQSGVEDRIATVKHREQVTPANETPSPTQYRIAQTRAELNASFELVYQSYVESGLTTQNLHGKRVSMFHTLPTTDVLIATSDSQVICTLTMIGDGELGIPLESHYREEVARKRANGIRFVEVGALARRDGTSFSVLSRLMQMVAHRSDYLGIDELLIAVHPHHAKFYERFFCFAVFGGLRRYRDACDRLAVAMALDLRALPNQQAVRRAYGKPFPRDSVNVGPLCQRLRREIHGVAMDMLNGGDIVVGASGAKDAA